MCCAGGGDQIFSYAAAIPITYSCVQGGGTANGNTNLNPLFTDTDGADSTLGTADDNLRLGAGSPCIDAGDNAAVPAALTTDLDGDPRFVDDPGTVDSGAGSPPIVDMGAYEVQ